MRKQVNEIVKIISENLPKKIKVLEIGSLIVPGQEHLSVRKYFPDAEYIGVDMQKGNGVDVVKDFIDWCNQCENEKHDGLNYRYDHENEFDLVLCLDMLEHAKDPFNIINSAKDCLKANGVLLVTSVFNFPIHEYPNDYWRFTPDCFNFLMGDNAIVYKIGSELMPYAVVGTLCPESKAFHLSRNIYLYCEEETKKELKHKAIVDWFPPKFIKLYMKVKYFFKNL